MAKVKQQELTLEEKLQQALVPEDEQPYKVPENWVWIYLTKGFADCLDSIRKPVNAEERANRIGKIPYYGATGQVGWIDDYLIDDNLVLLGEDGAPFFDYIKDKAYIINGKAWVNNHAHILKSYYGEVGNKYLMHYLNIFDYRGYANGTTRLKLTQANMNKIPVPLPPLAEQQRIVDRIETLFAKLDQAKELAQNALDMFETRKAAILHKAFTGELTAKWREENGVGMESWEEKRLGECGQWFGGGTPSTKNELFWKNGDVLWVTPKDMKSITITDSIDKITFKAISESAAELIEKPAILFVLRSGILRRILPIAMSTQPVTINQDMKALIPDDGIDLTYLCWFCISRERDIREKCSKSGTTVESINTKSLYSYMVQIPSLPEQREIVRILNSLLDKKQKAKELYDVIDKIALIKKAILAKAFRGELGTNDPSEESAMELLKECLRETVN